MEAFLILLGLAVLGFVFIMPIVAVVSASGARREVQALRGELMALRQQLASGVVVAEAPPISAPDAAAAPLAQAHTATSPATFAPAPIAATPVASGWGAPPPPPVPPSQPVAPTPVDALAADGPAAPPPVDPPSLPPPMSTPKPAKPGLEQLLGARALIWVGAAALSLSGLFLAAVAAEMGLFPPAVRCVMAVLFGAGLIAAGNRMRSRDERMAQLLVGAGIVAQFGALFAAVALYDLMPRWFGGALAFVLTSMSIGLALRFGSIVAGLGFLGGVAAPAFLGGDAPNAVTLFGYLFALSAGTLAVIRHRGWWWLGWGVLVGTLVWSGLWAAGVAMDENGFRAGARWAGVFQVAVMALFAWATWQRTREDGPAGDRVALLMWAAALVTGGLLVILMAPSPSSRFAWLALAVHGGLLFVLARFAPRHQWLAALAPALSLIAFFAWRGPPHAWGRPFDGADDFAMTIVAMGGLYAASAFALLWNAGRPGFWAGLSAGAAFLHMLLAYGALRSSMPGWPWGLTSLVLAVPYLVGAERLVRYRHAMPGGTEALGFVAAGVTLFVAAAIPFQLREQWVTMAYALALPAIAWIAWKLDVRTLRLLCWPLATTVIVRLVVNPWVLDYALGGPPILNWILYTYGLSALCFFVASWFLKLAREDVLTRIIDAATVVFLFLLVTLEIRSLFRPEEMASERWSFVERATYVLAWGAFALAALRVHRFGGGTIARVAWMLVGGLALLSALGGQVLVFNPILWREGVGDLPILNGLLPGYAVPAAMCALAAWLFGGSGHDRVRRLVSLSALVLAFVWVTSEVRHSFDPAFSTRWSRIGPTELYVYSAVWVLFGAALLGWGFWRGLKVARQAGLAVVGIAVCKVFIVDTAHLTAVLRVLSFMGLGVALMVLGFVYRRFVFNESRPAAAEDDK